MVKKGDFLSEQERLLLEQQNASLKVDETIKPKVKSTKVPKLVKLFTSVVLALTLAVSSFVVANCMRTQDPGPGPGPGKQTEIPEPDPGTGGTGNEIPDPGTGGNPGQNGENVDPYLPGKDGVAPIEALETFLVKLNDDYSYLATRRSDKKSTKYLINENQMQIVENDDEKGSFYYEDESGNSFNLIYSEQDEKWHKTTAETIDFDSIIRNSLESATWEGYDGRFFGTMDGKQTRLEITESGIAFFSEDTIGQIYDIDKTAIVLPEISEVIDETIEEPIVEPDPVEYVFEAGEFNSALMANILENWLKGDNQWKKDFFAEKRMDDDYKTDKVVYFQKEDDPFRPGEYYFCFGTSLTVNGESYFCEAYFNDTKFYNMLNNKTEITSVEFVDYLNSINKSRIGLGRDIQCEYTTLNATTEQKDEFNILTKNIMKRFSDMGTNDSIDDRIEDFYDAKILFGFKTPAGEEVVDSKLGKKKEWEQHYVLEYNGNLEFVTFTIESSTKESTNEKTQVLKDNYYWYNITSITRSEIFKDSEKLFEEENEDVNQTEVNAAVKSYYIYKEKDREL